MTAQLFGNWNGITSSRQPNENSSDLRSFVRRLLQGIRGIDSVQVTWDSPQARTKFYIVLATHDLPRDEKIVESMCQLHDVDFDLVPKSAQSMIPSNAEHFSLQ